MMSGNDHCARTVAVLIDRRSESGWLIIGSRDVRAALAAYSTPLTARNERMRAAADSGSMKSVA